MRHELKVDTVKVAVLDPHEVSGAVADQRRHLGVFLPLHQDGHEVVDLIHVHVPHVVTADQHLDANNRKNKKKRGRGHHYEGANTDMKVF